MSDTKFIGYAIETFGFALFLGVVTVYCMRNAPIDIIRLMGGLILTTFSIGRILKYRLP